jgi:lauroyl/myristoyl acyltransferase
VIGRVRARLSHDLARVLGGVASRSPNIAFRACDWLAALWARTSPRPTRAQLRALFPDVPAQELSRVLRQIWSSHARTTLLGGWYYREHMAPVYRLTRANDAIRDLRSPMIVGTFHIGPTLATGTIRGQLDGELLVLRGNVGTTDQERAATFHRAIERLRDGFVLMALDPREAQRIEVPFLGSTLQLARGPFAMARVARVPITPLIARWEGNAIELVLGEPLAISTDERELASAAARWFERYLREHPGELSYRVLELMRSSS